jgi:hypothetical protein
MDATHSKNLDNLKSSLVNSLEFDSKNINNNEPTLANSYRLVCSLKTYQDFAEKHNGYYRLDYIPPRIDDPVDGWKCKKGYHYWCTDLLIMKITNKFCPYC